METEAGASHDVVKKVLDDVSTALAVVAGVAVTLMMVQITVDVTFKNLFHQPIIGTTEIISSYYMPATIFLPLAAVEAQRRHITVVLFTQALPPRAVAGFDVFANVIGVLYAGCLTWSTTASAVLHTRNLESLDATFFDIPVWPTRWFLPIGVGCLTLYLLLHVVKDLWVALGKASAEARLGEAEAEVD
jgi:TRAP-type C4-dicarboxylate transport system permease small subunit